MFRVGGWVEGGWRPIFDAEFKNAKIPNFHLHWVMGAGWGGGQFLMLSPKMLKSQIPMSRLDGGGGVDGQLLMLSPKMLKSQIPMSRVGGWGGGLTETYFQKSTSNFLTPVLS